MSTKVEMSLPLWKRTDSQIFQSPPHTMCIPILSKPPCAAAGEAGHLGPKHPLSDLGEGTLKARLEFLALEICRPSMMRF